MATLKDVIAGLTIIAKYDGEKRHAIAAEHDEIFAGYAGPDAVSAADHEALIVAGWNWDSEREAWRRYV